MLEQRIQQQFFDAADLKYRSAESLIRPIAEASQAIVGVLTAGGKLLVCGIGPSAALASLCAAQLMGRFERERPGLAVIALGGGRARAGDAIDLRVGFSDLRGVGARVTRGEPLAIVHAGSDEHAEAALRSLAAAIRVEDQALPMPAVHAVVDA